MWLLVLSGRKYKNCNRLVFESLIPVISLSFCYCFLDFCYRAIYLTRPRPLIAINLITNSLLLISEDRATVFSRSIIQIIHVHISVESILWYCFVVIIEQFAFNSSTFFRYFSVWMISCDRALVFWCSEVVYYCRSYLGQKVPFFW